MRFITAGLLALAVLLPASASADQFVPDRRVAGCFGGEDKGKSNLNAALDRVTEFEDMYDSESIKIVEGGDCWWHYLPKYGTADQYWEGFYRSRGWIFPRWLHDVTSRSPETDIYWSDEAFLAREWRIESGRSCGREQRREYGECLVPIDRDRARRYLDWKRRSGYEVPPYIYIPPEWRPKR